MSELIEVKTADLIGYALDWAVGQAVHDKEPGLYLGSAHMWLVGPMDKIFNPSADWSQGGPLIEKYKVNLSPPTSLIHRNFGYMDKRNGYYEAGAWGSTIFGRDRKHRRTAFHHPDSPLIVAMRAIVQFELGDTVQVPAALITTN